MGINKSYLKYNNPLGGEKKVDKRNKPKKLNAYRRHNSYIRLNSVFLIQPIYKSYLNYNSFYGHTLGTRHETPGKQLKTALETIYHYGWGHTSFSYIFSSKCGNPTPASTP